MGDFIAGYGLGLSLIVAIGSQNAFVLRQGIRREHVLAVCLVCALSDAALIAAGVAGIGEVARAAPWVPEVLRWGGVAFLAVYGALAAAKAIRGGEALRAGTGQAASLWAVVATALAFTWLNPHVYLDTLILVGTVAASRGGAWVFGAGAMAASVTFFFGLGYGARFLAPVFARPGAWRMLDGTIAIVMWAIALGLIFG